jgi:phosphohistidine phosphatase
VTDRTLVIMRHAKAEQSASKRDIDRLLTERGRQDANAAGTWLTEQGLSPDTVLCSPAARTRGTWHEVAVGLAEGTETTAATVHYEPNLYDGGLSAALEVVREVDPNAKIVLLIGHNPTVSALSHRLDDAHVRAAGGLRTSGIAVHSVTTAWADCAGAALTADHTPRS